MERPFRNVKHVSRRGLVTSGLLCTLGLAVFGVGVVAYSGVPNRYSAVETSAFDVRKDFNFRTAYCQFNPSHQMNPDTLPPECSLTLAAPMATVMFTDDSHAGAISGQGQDALAQINIASLAVAYSGCIALPGFQRVDRLGSTGCDQFNRLAHGVAKSQSADVIVLTSRFPLYLSGRWFNNGEGGQEAGFTSPFVDLLGVTHWLSKQNDPIRKQRV